GLLKGILQDQGLEFIDGTGEAAFYGPKIDFIAKDALGRDWQLATIQLDFNLPERFNLTYTNEKGEEERVVMLHRAITGSVERFLSLLIEHYAGAFPVWLAPEQVRLLAVSERHVDFVKTLQQEFIAAGIRAAVDVSDNTVGKKIREAEKMKVPYILVIGDKEQDGGKLAIRRRGQQQTEEMEKAEFIEKVRKEIEERS